MISLKNFEKFIEAKIINRGFFDYYGYGYLEVNDVAQVAKDEFVAKVYGSNEYDVYIHLDDYLSL